MNSTPITKPRSISGFPEWLPQEKRIEDQFLSTIQSTFESFGFSHIETAAIELTEVLASKGLEQKEIYSLIRYHAEDQDANKFSLHFDLTVPFARYVALNQSQLSFPFKRYQIQKVWRGERPAQGRFREFYQCDIDVVGIESLPYHYDAELLEVIGQVFSRLNLGNITFKLNHRKLLQGFYESLGIPSEQQSKILIEVDKLDKIGPEKVAEQLNKLNLEEKFISRILEFASASADSVNLEKTLSSLNVDSSLFHEGKEELISIVSIIPPLNGITLEWHGSITRGLNYYTGAIFETEMEEAKELGSICSGGRYENLCQRFSKTKMPGVGISIGLTRLLSYLLSKKGLASEAALSPTQILISPITDEHFLQYKNLAKQIRELGINVELNPPGKLKKQLNYSNRKKIPYTIIPNEDGSYEFKDMNSGEQSNFQIANLIQHCKSLSVS